MIISERAVRRFRERVLMGASLLSGEEGPAILVNEDGSSPVVLICEHAARRLPKALGTLGLGEADLSRHIAWDIGAEGVARLLSRLLDAPLVLQRYSRLAYDCNRPPDSPDAMPEVSEIFAVPGNQRLTPAAKLARIEAIYRPFHEAVARLLDRRAAHGKRSVVVSLHSFTRVYRGKERKVELGLLFDRDPALANRLLKAIPNLDVRLNEPYGPKDGVMHTLNLHAAPRGLPHVMIEIRNDFIETERGQLEWAQRLSLPLIQAATHQGD
jgi:predicted N-formylglutamate amidohydrolase